jgi:hypothetical protein
MKRLMSDIELNMKRLMSIYGSDSSADRVASRTALGTATCTIHVASHIHLR